MCDTVFPNLTVWYTTTRNGVTRHYAYVGEHMIVTDVDGPMFGRAPT